MLRRLSDRKRRRRERKRRRRERARRVDVHSESTWRRARRDFWGVIERKQADLAILVFSGLGGAWAGYAATSEDLGTFWIFLWSAVGVVGTPLLTGPPKSGVSSSRGTLT